MTTKEIVKLACPDYNGRKITVGEGPAPKHLDSYWDEGYRTYYHFVRLADKHVDTLHSNHPGFEPGRPRVMKNELPKGYALVCRHFMGEKQSVSVWMGTGEADAPILGI